MRRRSNPFSKGDARRWSESTPDLWLRIVAVALAFLLWTVTKSDSRKVVRDVPIRVVNAEADEWVILRQDPPAVDVRVSGPVRELIRLTSNRAVVEVRLDEVTDSLGSIALRPTQVQLFDGADSTRVEAVLGDSVRLRLDRIVERVLPVATRTSGAVPAGMVLAGRPRALPPQVRLRGAASRVGAPGLDSIILPPVDLGNLSGTDTVTVAVDVSALGVLSVYPTAVDVIVPLRLIPPDSTRGDVAHLPRGGRR